VGAVRAPARKMRERGGGREGDVGRSPARQQQVCYIYYHDSFFGLRIRVTEWRLKT